MKFAKKVFSLILCASIGLNAGARIEAPSEHLTPVTAEERIEVLRFRDYLFKNSGLSQYFIKKAHLAKLSLPQSNAPENFKTSALRKANHFAMSFGVNGLQSVLVGAMTLLAASAAMNCQQMALRNQDDCMKWSVLEKNSGMALDFMISSSEFYAGMIGAFSSTPLMMAMMYLIKSPQGLSVFKKIVISGAQSILIYMGMSFCIQFWKESVVMFSPEDQEIAHKLIYEKISHGVALKSLDPKSQEVFHKITSIMVEILFNAPELREKAIYNWWRLEMASGKGVNGIASMIPAMYYGLKGTTAGVKQGWKGGVVSFLIMGALGFLGGFASALVPQSILRKTTLVMQHFRGTDLKAEAFYNEYDIDNLLGRYASNPSGKAAFLSNKSEEEKIAENKKETKEKLISYLSNRKKIRNKMISISYEKIYDAQMLIEEHERTTYIASTVLIDEQIKKDLVTHVAIGEDGHMTYVESDQKQIDKKLAEADHQRCAMMTALSEIPYLCEWEPKIEDGYYQRAQLQSAQAGITELRAFIKEESSKINKFYFNEYKRLNNIKFKYGKKLPLDIILLLDDAEDDMALLQKYNKGIISGLLTEEDSAYVNASTDLVNLQRDQSYDEDLLEERIKKAKNQLHL